MTRIAVMFDKNGFFGIQTDDPTITVFTVDEASPGDRVYQLTAAVERISPSAFERLVGTNIGKLGDKPVEEQAVRAKLGPKLNGKPALKTV